MKRQIRFGVFETNSSSCHTITVSFKNVTERLSFKALHEYQSWDYDGNKSNIDTVKLSFGEYGWGPDVVYGEIDKTKYLLTMVGMLENFKNEEEFYQTEGFKTINEVIKEKTPYENGIKMTNGSFNNSKWDHFIDGYIDHQSSTDDYKSLQDFCETNNITVEEFIFNPEVFVMVDNDNF